MKNMYYSIIFTIFISVVALTGCTSSVPSPDAEKAFAEMYKDCSMNKDLRLSLGKSTDIGSKDVNLLLESISDSSVIFPAGYNIHILQFENGGNNWAEKENHIQYLPLDEKKYSGKITLKLNIATNLFRFV